LDPNALSSVKTYRGCITSALRDRASRRRQMSRRIQAVRTRILTSSRIKSGRSSSAFRSVSLASAACPQTIQSLSPDNRPATRRRTSCRSLTAAATEFNCGDSQERTDKSRQMPQSPSSFLRSAMAIA
jgi:hypothetical protein